MICGRCQLPIRHGEMKYGYGDGFAHVHMVDCVNRLRNETTMLRVLVREASEWNSAYTNDRLCCDSECGAAHERDCKFSAALEGDAAQPE